jgi:hypothetical protein
MPQDFEEVIGMLAAKVGLDARQATVDEHSRWDLYRRAIDVETSPSLVLAALREEPNLPLASATVVRAIEHRSPLERDRWLEVLLPGPSLDYARRRADELGTLERLRDDPEFQVSATEVAGWTQWLQRKVAEECDRQDVLEVLRAVGATKRIRRRALDRVNAL